MSEWQYEPFGEILKFLNLMQNTNNVTKITRLIWRLCTEVINDKLVKLNLRLITAEKTQNAICKGIFFKLTTAIKYTYY